MITAGIPMNDVLILKNLYTQKEEIRNLTESYSVRVVGYANDIDTTPFVIPEVKTRAENKGRASK